jgi:hypothetical protein
MIQFAQSEEVTEENKELKRQKLLILKELITVF